MLLIGVKEENGWLLSTFNLTYRVDWKSMCKAVSIAYDYYRNTEILINDKKVEISSKDEIPDLEEALRITVRGMSEIIGVPLMITFHNQLQNVDVSVACATEEFKSADYRKFNMSLGQYMDSLELAMYR